MSSTSTHTPIPTAHQIARGDCTSVALKVHGFWSSDSIRVYARIIYGSVSDFKVEITHASGGRDTNEVGCDIEAEDNFGVALQRAAEIGRQLKAIGPDVLNEYAIYKAELQAESDADKAAQQAAIDADPAMTTDSAKKLVEMIAAGDTARMFNRGAAESMVSVYKQGRFFYILENCGYNKRTVCVSKNDLLGKLITLSARYTIA